jgi:hypothetical protein
MDQDACTLLSLVATGRMSSAEAERWLAASREDRLERSLESSENRWILAALILAALMQFGPAVTQFLPELRHLISLVTGQI